MSSVIAGRVPAIHDFGCRSFVDGRDKHGHDDIRGVSKRQWLNAFEDGVEEFGAPLFEIARRVAEHRSPIVADDQVRPQDRRRSFDIAGACAACRASAVVSCQTSTRKPAISSFSRVACWVSRKLVDGSCAHCTG